MKKLVSFYTIIIFFITIFAILIDFNWVHLLNIHFSILLHKIFESITALIFFLIFLKSNYLYLKTKNKALIILAAGFLVCFFLHIFHIFASNKFPYDILTIENIQKKPQLLFLLSETLILAITIFVSILHMKKTETKTNHFVRKTYLVYFFILIFTLLTGNYLMPLLQGNYGYKILLFAQSCNILNETFYFIILFILADIKITNKQTLFSKLTISLILLGFGELFYIKDYYFKEVYGILSHILKIIGFVLFLIGIDELQIPNIISFRQKLLAYLSLFILFPYLFFVSLISVIFNINLPMYSQFLFLDFMLITISIQSILVTKFIRPINTVIDVLEQYKAGEKLQKIDISSTDEIGLLIDKLNKITEESSKIDEIKKTFIATLTHDLKSPIIAEQKALEFMISKENLCSEMNFKEYLQDIHKTNEDLLKIVNNLLLVYHYESGRFLLNKTKTNIKEIIENSVKTLKYLAEEKEMKIFYEIEDNLPLINIDKDEINRVVLNLIGNAIRHTKKGIFIKVNAVRKKHFIQISIQDNGEGISKDRIPTIFERYPTEKRKVGTGLGLYLSKQIVEAHDGKIWFETEEGKGTTFYFTLPI